MIRISKERSGLVSLEMAITIPIVLMMFMGTIEFSRVAMLRHTLDNAAYEAARAGIVPGATADQVRAEATRVLSVVRASDFVVEVFPEEITDNTDQLSIVITAPIRTNGYWLSRFFGDANLVAKCTKPRLTIAAVVPTAIPAAVAAAATSTSTSEVPDPPPAVP